MLSVTRRLLQFRNLLITLVQRELKARYRGSVLGFLWSLVTPLVLLGVYTFVFTFIFEPKFEGTDPYVLFLMTGLFTWTWIAGALLEGTQAVTANGGLIRKAVFPAEVLPIVNVVANLVHFLLALPILAAGMIVGRISGYDVGGWSVVALLPVIVLLAFALGGLTLALSVVNVHFKDIKDIVSNLLALLFYLTPVIYPLAFASRYPALRGFVVWFNPFTPFVQGVQDTVFYGRVPDATVWLHMLAWAAGLWIVGSWLFDRLSDSLVEAV